MTNLHRLAALRRRHGASTGTVLDVHH